MASKDQIIFLKELEKLSSTLKQQIEAKEFGLDPSPTKIRSRRKRVLGGDFKWFAYTYFPHHIWSKPSVFQTDFCKLFPKLLLSKEGSRDWWVAPRGESKSTLLTKIGCVYVAVLGLLQNKNIREALDLPQPPTFIDYCILFGAETKFPTKLLTVIKTELTCNPALALDFGDAVGATDTWKVAEIKTKTGVSFEPRGAEQAVRGAFSGASRPKLLIADDLITDSEAKSPTECTNRWEWLEKSVDYLGPPDGSVKFMAVGTTLSNHDPIARARACLGHQVHIYQAIITEPERVDLWESCEKLMREKDTKTKSIDPKDLPSYKFYLKNKQAMDCGSTISWPQVRSLYWLMRQRAKNRNAFNCEMQASPRSDDEKVFKNIQFWIRESTRWIYYGAVDPSVGNSTKADPSSIVIGGFDPDKNTLNIVHCATYRRTLSQLETDIITAHQHYNCQLWGFESNGAFDHTRLAIMKSALDKSVALPMRGIVASAPLAVRIESLEPHIACIDPQIRFQQNLTSLLDELDNWPQKQPHHHYDGLSALWVLWQITSKRTGGLPQITNLPTPLFNNRLNTF